LRSMATARDSILQRKREHYDREIERHGCTALSVGWNSTASQELRFQQLLKVANHGAPFSLNDFGCGYGALVDYLRARQYKFKYCGFDISPQMIKTAKGAHPESDEISFIGSEAELAPADYTIASGIFNGKFETSLPEWEEYILETLAILDRISTKGFAFNLLTRYSDPELMRPDLYYADPAFLFDYCQTKFSRFVTLLHDYPLYEFTILVRRTAEKK
jgi:SAM-dependent methyltransferase